MSELIRYGDWAKDRQGWFMGQSGATWATVIGAGFPALLAAGVHRWWLAAGWLPVWALICLLLLVPVRGRTALVWSLHLSYRTLGGMMGWTPWQSKAAAGTLTDPHEADLPGVLSGIRTHDGPPYGPMMTRPAVIADSISRTWAATARITHPGIGLAEADTRRRMAEGLTECLESVAASRIASVVALQVRTVPDDGAERINWHRANLRIDAPAVVHQITTELGEAIITAGVRHESFITVVVPESNIGRQAREAGGGVDGHARVLYGAMGELEARLLGSVGCSEVTWLDSAALSAAIRTGFAPGERAGLMTASFERNSNPKVADELPMAAAGPSAAPAAEMRHYTHDAWSSTTCTVLLPDQGALMGALAPVFTPTEVGERRSVTVFYEAIDKQKADRMVGRETMSAGSAAELRNRMGFASRASHRRDAARVQSQDTRLASGRAYLRVGIAAAVTVPSTWSVPDAGRRLESSIRSAGFIPQRLDLAQDTGFAAACVPLGIGLPKRRGVR